jgi:hypothetical protein
MIELDVKHIGREVRRLMLEEGIARWEASNRVAAKITGKDNGRLKNLHETGFLSFACAEAEARTLHTDPITVINGGDQLPSATHDRREAPAVRGRYDAFHTEPLKTVMPIPGTNRRVKIGDWTREDVKAYEEYCGVLQKTWHRKKKTIHGIWLKMKDGETLGDVWPRLSEDDRQFLLPGLLEEGTA